MARDLLVPGTSSTKLLLDGEDIGWPGELTVAGWLAKRPALTEGFEKLDEKYPTPRDIENLLSMQYSADATVLTAEKTTLWRGGAMAPGPLLRLAYNQFNDFETFLYDWRQDIRRSADLLLDRLTGKPGDPWRIVCHSQGGLVVVAAAGRLAERTSGGDDRAFSRIVSHVAFIGVPFHGTLKAADAFIKGEELAPPAAAVFKRVARTWPALYQMLPTWLGCVRTFDGAGGELTQQTNLLQDEPWTGQQMVPAMLDRARRARAYLRAPMASLNGVKKRIFQSRAYDTPDHVVRTTNGLQVTGAVPGDTLVADDITRDAGGDIQKQLTVSIGQNGNTLVHSMLADDPTFATAVKDFLAQ
jgi:pimeloyl-ACP methyl ester carboxylesterase